MRQLSRPASLLTRILVGDSLASRAASLMATVTAGASFMPGLVARGRRDQVLLTGVASALQHGLVVNAQARHRVVARVVCSWTGRADEDGVRRMEGVVAAATSALGGAAFLALPARDGESVERRMVRTMGLRMLRVGLATTVVWGAGMLDEQYGDRRRVVKLVAPVAGFLVGTSIAAWFIARTRRYDPVIASRRSLTTDPLTGESLHPDKRAESTVVRPPLALALGFGVAVALNVLGDAEIIAARQVARLVKWLLPGSDPYAGLVGHTVVLGSFLGGLGLGMEYLYRQAEAGGSAIDAAYTTAPTSALVSGGPDSGIDWQTLGREGVRFVAMSLAPEEIATVTGTPIEQVKSPIRCFAGLETSPTVGGRVNLVMEDLERLGAFERSVICLTSPTGTGYLNYVAVETLEYLTRGDCATVGLQYSLRPSFLSLDRVRMAREQNLALLNALTWRIRGLPEGNRPRLVGFGESLGAQTLQSCFQHEGAQGFRRVGMESALFLGTPAGSHWAGDWRDDPAHEDPDHDVLEVSGIADWRAATDAGREPRIALLNNHDDPITKFTGRLAVARPRWLPRRGPRPAGIPHATVWFPYTTMLVILVDVVNAIDFVPGVFVSRGHDYRASIAQMVSAVYRLPATDQEMAQIEHALRQREKLWADRRMAAEQLVRAGESVSRTLRRVSEISNPGAEPASQPA